MTISEETKTLESQPLVHRAVYELNDDRATKCFAVLRSMRNHIAGKGGPAFAKLALMVHDEAHAYFITAQAPAEIAQIVQELLQQEVKLYVCGNTLKRFKVDPSEMLPGFEVKPEGAMVGITDLVMSGYVYLRP